MNSANFTRGLNLRIAVCAAALAMVCCANPGMAGWNPFSPGSRVEVGPQSGQIVLADFNGDGRGDILASHPLRGQASLLLGDGSGDFPVAGRSTIKFDYDPSALAAGDVNGDKRLDLVIASRDEVKSTLHILLGNGKGEFKEFDDARLPPGKIAPKGWKPFVEFADVNRDGNLDLISANGRHHSVEVFYGDGGGKFALGQTITLEDGFDRYTHLAGDVNGDERLDLAVAYTMAEGDAPAQLRVLLGNEQGELIEAPELSSKVPTGAHLRALCDVNGDKRTDIALTHGNLTTLLVQSSDGKLGPLDGSPYAIGKEAFGIAAVNVGIEGNDVLVAATVDSLDVVFSHQGSELQHACNTPMAAGPGAYNVSTGDLNGDGKDDVVANSFGGDSLTLLLTN